ncbi:hypothetical protein QCA50_011385 [Cerrena zonata]|uniref:HMG box domain-containing protein n=1 Tax=Cerrena zonata TaxID=2478898 RepID=A0AAW0G2H0_9APHY
MPALRATTRGRRRSSVAAGLLPLSAVKPGNYGINITSPRNVSFAPNVTPSTYVEAEEPAEDEEGEPASPTDALFPPAEAPAPAPSRRRVPPGKRRSLGYIPRPPNAFMLFRADFVRQKHVPGSIETNHGSLSKIIGNCWRQLPLEEKKIWESRAKKAKADHKEQYPNYRFRPVHKKHKKRDQTQKEKVPMSMEDERRCEEVAHFLLEGKKGDELAAAVRMFDTHRDMTMSASASPMLHMPIPLPMMPHSGGLPLYAQRRSSSVPPPTTLYHPINIPNVPFLIQPQPQHPISFSRPESPVSTIARSNRMMLGQRRASSVGASLERHWLMSPSEFYAHELQRDNEPLPEVDHSLFEQSFGFSMAQPNDLFLQTHAAQQDLSLSISPLEPLSTTTSVPSCQASAFPFYSQEPAAPEHQQGHFHGEHMNWLPPLDASSGPSSAFSGSPSPSEGTLPAPSSTSNVTSPQPMSYVAQPHEMIPVEPEFTFDQLHDISEFQHGYEIDQYSQGDIYGSDSQNCGMETAIYGGYQDYATEVPQF